MRRGLGGGKDCYLQGSECDLKIMKKVWEGEQQVMINVLEWVLQVMRNCGRSV